VLRRFRFFTFLILILLSDEIRTTQKANRMKPKSYRRYMFV